MSRSFPNGLAPVPPACADTQSTELGSEPRITPQANRAWRGPRSLLFAALPVLAGSCGSGEAPRTVLLVSLDTTRSDALNFEDPFVTPRMVELAEHGTVFEQAISGSSWTLPAHAQMFTGQPPTRHGVEDDNVRIDPATPTMPELLAEAGFLGYGVFTGWYLLRDYGFGRGFEVYSNGMPGGDRLEAELRNSLARKDAGGAQNVWGAADQQSHRAITSPGVVEFVGQALDDVGEDDLFLFTHLFDPHYDYVPPAPYDTRFDPGYEGSITGQDFYLNPAVFDAEAGGRQISDRDLEHIIALYMGEVAWTDEHVGQIVDLLRVNERLENAWIVITADHGEEFFEHGGRGHRHSLFDEQVRVPLLVVPPTGTYPQAPPRVSVQAGLSDLLPTLCEAIGVPIPDTAIGRSLLPVLRGEELPSVPQVSSLRGRPIVSATGGATKHIVVEALRTPTEKLVRRVSWKGDEPKLLEALWYDLESDPYEESPVRNPKDPRLIAAWEQLEAQRGDLRSHFEARPVTPIDQRTTSAREMWADNLAALGYVEEGEELTDDLPSWGLGPAPPVELP